MLRTCTVLLVLCTSVPTGLFAQSKPAAPAPKPPTSRPAQRKPAAPAPVAKPVAKAPEPPKRIPPDVQLTSIHASGTTTTLSTVQLKGARARISMGDTLASIQQCDAARTLQLNTQTRTFLNVPFESASVATPAAADGKADRKKGGEVIYTTTVTDTGETQPMFGFTARRLKTVVSKDITTNACDKKLQRVETDGWYIDLPPAVSCATAPVTEAALQVDPKNPDCVDTLRYEHAATPTGYPLKYTSIATTGDDAPVTTTMEVKELERVDLDAAAFEVPSDYLEVRVVSQLTADHRPGEPGTKRPGTLRVGLLPLSNKSDARLATTTLDDAMLDSFSETDLDIVRVIGTTAAELDADARAKGVDLLLTSTIAEVKVPRGGIVGKVSGSSGDAFTAKVDYQLVAPGQAKPRDSGSERSGGSTLNSAINLAKKVAQFAPPVMMAKYSYMNAYGSMLSQQNGPSGAMRQSPDPVMNMAFSLLDRASAKTAPEQFSTQEGAVASALEKVIRSVTSDLAKKK